MDNASFSLTSIQRLSTCDIRLQRIMCEVVKIMDITIICGTRNKIDQEKAFDEGKSKVHYPNSMHNSLPSKAVDIAPWYPTEPHIRWDDSAGFTYLAGIVKGIATSMGFKLRWGGDWDKDNDLQDEKGLRDFPHFEIVD